MLGSDSPAFHLRTGILHQTRFSFVGEEISRLREFISNLRLVQFPSDERVNVTDRELKKLLLSPDQIRNVLVQNRGMVENALRRLAEKIEPTSDDGEPTGEKLFAYQPKSFLVVGRRDELHSQCGINMEKYRSFELYPRHTHRPEIITFDELFHRARFIVEHLET